MELWQRTTIVLIGFVESLLFSGCLFGWPSLLHVLQQEGVYSHVCPNNAPMQLIPVANISTNLIPTEKWADNLLPQDKNQQQSTLSSELLEDFLPLEDDKESLSSSLPSSHCDAQTVEMTLVYTVAAVTYGLTSILVGFSLDICGLWFTRFLGSIMTTGGFLCLAFTSKDVPWLLWPALNLIALGTSQLRLSTFQFANLWPSRRTTILILYSSAYSISTAIFLIIQYTYSWGIPYKAIGFGFVAVSLLTFPATLLMPRMKIDDHVDKPDERRKLSDIYADKITKRLTPEDQSSKPIKSEERVPMNPFDPEDDEQPVYKTTTSDEVPLGTSLWTVSAFLHIFWHFINFFLVLFYSATFVPWIQKMTDDRETVAHYNKVSGLCALIAPCFIPIAGLVTDWQIQKASQREDRVVRMALTMQAPAFTMAVATLFILATMISKLFFTETAVYFSLGLIAISRPFIVGSCASYLRLRFHPTHFNRLNGIFTSVVSVFALVLYPILLWMKNSNEDFVNAQVVLIILLVISFSSPGHLLIKRVAFKYAREQLKYRDS